MIGIFYTLLGFFVLIIIFKGSYFLILILLEVRLILVASLVLQAGLGSWFILPLLGIGACESTLGLATAVALSRTVSVSAWSV